MADFPIRLTWTSGLLSEPDSLWIVVGRDAFERGIDGGP
jgi:hypothetical protein